MKTSSEDVTSAFVDDLNKHSIIVTWSKTTNSYSGIEPYKTVLPSNINVFSRIYSNILKLEDPEVTKQVHQVLLNLYLSLQKISKYQSIENYLSRINLVQMEDKTALLEWNFEDFRVGFNLEPDKNDSSYFIVSQDKRVGHLLANTQKIGADLWKIVEKIVEYVLENT